MKTASAVLSALVFLMLSFSCMAENRLQNIHSWLCFYGDSFQSETMPAYDLYILDRTFHPELAPLKNKGARVAGYISAGEINRKDPDFKKIPRQLRVEENKDWKGSYRVDLRNRAWQNLIVDEIIPQVLSRGFDGIFIDTIDVAWYLENIKKMKGSIKSAINLVKSIRKKYPGIIIILNNGIFLLDDVGADIDAVVVEDVYTRYDFSKKQYKMADPAWTAERLASLKDFQKKFGKPVLALDYLSPEDTADIAAVAAKARADGLIPYISDINLGRIFFHP